MRSGSEGLRRVGRKNWKSWNLDNRNPLARKQRSAPFQATHRCSVDCQNITQRTAWSHGPYVGSHMVSQSQTQVKSYIPWKGTATCKLILNAKSGHDLSFRSSSSAQIGSDHPRQYATWACTPTHNGLSHDSKSSCMSRKCEQRNLSSLQLTHISSEVDFNISQRRSELKSATEVVYL